MLPGLGGAPIDLHYSTRPERAPAKLRARSSIRHLREELLQRQPVASDDPLQAVNRRVPLPRLYVAQVRLVQPDHQAEFAQRPTAILAEVFQQLANLCVRVRHAHNAMRACTLIHRISVYDLGKQSRSVR